MISENFAEILGLLCSEGSHIIQYSDYTEVYRGKTRFRKNKRSERIEFYNKDPILLKHYQHLLQNEFQLNTKITKHGKINIGTKEIIKKIISHTQLGHLSWKVPKKVIEGSKEVKISFLRGFFDGDGTAVTVSRFFSTNKEGIKEISSLLKELNYRHTFQKPKKVLERKQLYCLQLSRKDHLKFLQEINPVSKKG